MAWVGGVLLGACATGQGERQTPPPTAKTEAAVAVSHPLVNRLWDVSAGAFMDEDALWQRARSSAYVVMGEVHDNPMHHLLEARMVEALAQGGRHGALVVEMVATDKQAILDAPPGDAAALGDALAWGRSGWPPWEMYQPVFAAALTAGWPLVAAGMPRELTRGVAKGNLAAAGLLHADVMGLDQPLAADIQAQMETEMQEAHCHALPPHSLPAMVRVQRVWDALMAQQMAARDGGSAVLLVAGSGHARADRAVPALLGRLRPGATVLTVGMVEVVDTQATAATYASQWSVPQLPFDVVWFTPPAPREDPCAQFRTRAAPQSAPAP